MTEQQNKKWWDERASQLNDPREVVAAGHYQVKPSTRNFLEGRIHEFLSQVRTKQLGMDAGCGTGLFIPMLLTHFQVVWGMDFSTAVLNKADERVRLDPRVKLFEGSITSIPLEDASLPFIFCKSTLQCISQEDVTRSVGEFFRVLQPGGQALIHFKNSSTIGYKLAAVKNFLRLRWGKARANLQQARTDQSNEEFVSGEVYFRPYNYYFKEFRNAGFRLNKFYSYQFYTWNYVQKHKMRWIEGLELALRKMPIVRNFIETDGIDFYVLLDKPRG